MNMEQSSNDVIPTAMHISAAMAIKESLTPSLEHLAAMLEQKAEQFDSVVKIGRTHLQDATPIRLGQELGGYAHQAKLGAVRCLKAIHALRELPLGGTAVGTGINSHPRFCGEGGRRSSRKNRGLNSSKRRIISNRRRPRIRSWKPAG